MPDLRRLPALAGRAVTYELSLYRSLLRWVLRRPATTDPEEEPVGYAQTATPVLLLWVFGSAVEIPVAHVLLPWESARTVVLALGVWGLLWMLGLLASLRAYPHLLGPSHLRVRQGPRIDLPVPWEEVESAAARRTDLPSSIRALQPREVDGVIDLHVAVGGETNVSLRLRRPLTLTTPGGERTFERLSLLVDDPRHFVAEVRSRLATARSAETSG